MSKNNRSLFLVCMSLTCLMTGIAAAKPYNINAMGDFRAQGISGEDMDLGSANVGSEDSQILSARVKVMGDLTPTLNFLTELRGVMNFGDGRGEDPVTGESLGPSDFVELRELWMEKTEIGGYQPVSLRFGRQRIAEPYGFWWNRNFDAARVFYKTSLFNAFLGAGENLSSYRTSGDGFNEIDEDIFRVFGETSLQWKYHHFVETRFMYQDDHSGVNPVGTVIRSNNRDDNDAELFWGGVRLAGQLPLERYRNRHSKYRFDLVGVAGSENSQSSATGTPGFRVTTGNRDRDIMGWAFDGGVDIALPVVMKPVLSLGYAYGSGDNDPTDGTNNAFRQTGIDSNFSYQGVSTGGAHNYGTVLRPDLSNLHILTAGIGAPLTRGSNLTVMYHYYRLAEEQDGLQSSGIRSNLTGGSSDLGQAVDLIFNINLGEQFNFNIPHLKGVDFRTTLGGFKAGDAYGTASDEVALRGVAEFRIRF